MFNLDPEDQIITFQSIVPQPSISAGSAGAAALESVSPGKSFLFACKMLHGKNCSHKRNTHTHIQIYTYIFIIYIHKYI